MSRHCFCFGFNLQSKIWLSIRFNLAQIIWTNYLTKAQAFYRPPLEENQIKSEITTCCIYSIKLCMLLQHVESKVDLIVIIIRVSITCLCRSSIRDNSMCFDRELKAIFCCKKQAIGCSMVSAKSSNYLIQFN